jgi:hypothetical protein
MRNNLKTSVFLAGLIMAAVVAQAGDLSVVGNMNVSSNLTAQSVTLGGQTRTNWPGSGANTLDQVVAAGNTTTQAIIVGKITVGFESDDGQIKFPGRTLVARGDMFTFLNDESQGIFYGDGILYVDGNPVPSPNTDFNNQEGNITTTCGNVDVGSDGSGTGEFRSRGKRINEVLTVYAAGTAAIVSTNGAMLDFGTTDPSLHVPGIAGNFTSTYAVRARVLLKYDAATFAGNQTATLYLYDTDAEQVVANSTTVVPLRTLTSTTDLVGVVTLPEVVVVAWEAGATLQVRAYLSAFPTAGTVKATEDSIIAQRMY